TGTLADTRSFSPVAPTGYTVPIRRIQAFIGPGLRRGWDIEAMMSRAGISPMLLAEDRARVTTTQVANLVQAVWSVTDDELLGLGAAPMPRGTFRLLTYGLLSSPDVATALHRFLQFSSPIPALPPASVSTHDGLTRMSVDLTEIAEPPELLVDVLIV